MRKFGPKNIYSQPPCLLVLSAQVSLREVGEPLIKGGATCTKFETLQKLEKDPLPSTSQPDLQFESCPVCCPALAPPLPNRPKIHQWRGSCSLAPSDGLKTFL